MSWHVNLSYSFARAVLVTLFFLLIPFSWFLELASDMTIQEHQSEESFWFQNICLPNIFKFIRHWSFFFLGVVLQKLHCGLPCSCCLEHCGFTRMLSMYIFDAHERVWKPVVLPFCGIPVFNFRLRTLFWVLYWLCKHLLAQPQEVEHQLVECLVHLEHILSFQRKYWNGASCMEAKPWLLATSAWHKWFA